jgi:hypothetical protein
MKINLLQLFFIFASINIAAQPTIQWADSIVVVNTSASITAPRIALLPDGTPLVTWGESGNGIASRIWCSRMDGDTFTMPVSVVQNTPAPLLFGFGGYDVALSGNLVFVVFERSGQGIFISRSDDGGLTFNLPVVVKGPESGTYATLSSVVVDGTNNPVVSYIFEKNGTATYQVRRSTDGGLIFNAQVTANAPAPGGKVCECCTSDLIASGDSVWILFRNNNQNIRDSWVSRSTDLAATFDTATDVDATDWQINACPISGPRLARSGDSLLAVWMSAANGTGHIYLNSLHAATMQAGQQLDFSDGSDPQSVHTQPDITASGDTVGVVYVKKAKEINFHFSTNGTSNLINQSTQFAIPDHILRYPSLSFRNGVFHLIYVDATDGNVIYRQGHLTQSSPAVEPADVFDVSIFPNPTTGIITVQTDRNPITALAVTDSHGKTIYLPGKIRQSEYQFAIDLRNNPPGIYFIHVNRKDGREYTKAISLQF